MSDFDDYPFSYIAQFTRIILNLFSQVKIRHLTQPLVKFLQQLNDYS